MLGGVRQTALARAAPAARAETVMEAGPSTIRPDTAPDQLRRRLDEEELTTTVLTDPDGRLLGIVRRSDLRRAD